MVNDLVSVIIPAKNAARTLECCLAALQRQTYDPIEVIVVDDGSTDETVAIAGRYGAKVVRSDKVLPASKDTGVHAASSCELLQRLADRDGRVRSRNIGARAARGTFLLHLDSDMELAPQSIMQCTMAIASGVDVVLLPERNVARGYWMSAYSFGKEIRRGIPGLEHGRFVSKAWFERLGGYDESLLSGEDRDFHLRLLAAGARPASIQALTLHHVEHLTLREVCSKTARYTRTHAVFLRKHPETAGEAWRERWQLFRLRWRLLLASPLRAAGWIALSVAFAARDAVIRWRLRRVSIGHGMPRAIQK